MRDDPLGRTTLDIDDDVLQAARELADPRRRAPGAPRPTMKLVNDLRDDA